MKQKLIIYFLFCTALTQAQNKMDNWWYLGSSIGVHPLSGGCSINFTYDSASVDTTPIDNDFLWTLSMISDSSGQLLFYNDNRRVYDRNNNIMINGDTLMNTWLVLNQNAGGGGPQGSIVLPLIDSNPTYYLFSVSSENDFGNFLLPSHLYLAKIDMSLNNGLGAVVSKNQALNYAKMDFYINAVKHGNGRDWWVLCHSAEGDTFYTFLLTPYGVDGPFTQVYGHINTWAGGHSSQGVQYFSPDGTKYVNSSNKRINLYDFDRCTGLLSNWQEKKIWAFPAFSPNSQVLYLSTGLAIEQYDLSKTNWKATRDTVAVFDSIVFDSCDYAKFSWPFLASDNRIYIPAFGFCRRNIHVIDSPDVVGIGCKVLQNKIIMPRFHRGTIPNYPNYRLGPLPGSVCDTLGLGVPQVGTMQGFSIVPNPAKDYFDINAGGISLKNKMLKIYDGYGNLLKSVMLTNDTNNRVSTVELSNGIYFIAIDNGAIDQYQKLVIVK